jgi:hypothetical protein
VCEERDQQAQCVAADSVVLSIGQSAPRSGPNQALGTEMKLGIELAFKEKNNAGGIRGRQLKLEYRDDGYQPDLAEAATRELLDVQVSPNEVPRCPSTGVALVANSTPVSATSLRRGPKATLAILGNVGTPTMVRAAPVAIETGTVFFGAFTGAATLLRDNAAGAACGRYIFNVRASYAQEAEATMEYFRKLGVSSHLHLISFDQDDSFGQSGYDGLVAAYRGKVGPFPAGADITTPIFRVRYMRNDIASVPAKVAETEAYLTQLLNADTSGNPIVIGIMMTDTYSAGSEYIHGLRGWQYDGASTPANKASRLKLHFSNVSFVGPNALADRLKSSKIPGTSDSYFTDNVVISQVVPNYLDDSSDVVRDYNRQIMLDGSPRSFTSLEGYISARLFIAGLEAHPGPFTADAIVDSFEKLPDLGLGIGPTAGFSATNHQYSSSVWGTILQPDGSFKNLYFWTKGRALQLFE